MVGSQGVGVVERLELLYFPSQKFFFFFKPVKNVPAP